jgi:hypothetical protein
VNDRSTLVKSTYIPFTVQFFHKGRKQDKSQNSKLKVNKNENFFGSDFEFCTISLFVLLKYKIQMCPFSAQSKTTLVYIAFFINV